MALTARSATVAAYGVGRLVPAVITIVSVPVWIRAFGPSAYGAFSVSLAALLATSALGTGWLRQAAMRFAGSPGRGILDHPLPILTVVVLVVAASTTAVVALVMRGTVITLASVFGFAATYAIYMLTQTAAQRDGHVIRFNAAEISRAGLALLGSLALLPASLDGTSCILLASTLGNLAAICLTSVPPDHQRRPGLWVVERSWRFGWPMSVWLGVSALTLYVDRLILGTVVAPSELGVYSANADLVVRGLTVVAAPVVLTIHPVVMREHNAGREAESRAALDRWSRILAALLGASVLLIVILGPAVVPLLLGEDALNRGTLAVLAIGAAVWQYALLAHKPFEVRHQTRLIMWFAVLALLVELAVSTLTVRPLGSLGVATGLLCSAVFYLACVEVGNRRFPHAPAAKTSVAGGVT